MERENSSGFSRGTKEEMEEVAERELYFGYKWP